jgi:hypothetical protein
MPTSVWVKLPGERWQYATTAVDREAAEKKLADLAAAARLTGVAAFSRAEPRS